MEGFPDSDKCKKCPHLQASKSEWLEWAEAMDNMQNTPIEAMVEAQRDLDKYVADLGLQARRAMSADDIVLGSMEHGMLIESHMEAIENAVRIGTEECEGSLTMKAVDRLGDEYRVTVCRSKVAPEGENREVATVFRPKRNNEPPRPHID